VRHCPTLLIDPARQTGVTVPTTIRESNTRGRAVVVANAQLSGQPAAAPVGFTPAGRLWVAGITCALVFVALTLDALWHRRAFFDLQVLQAVQRIDLPVLETLLRPVDWVTDGLGAVLMWTLVLFAFLVLHWWRPAMAVLTMPVGGVLTTIIDRLLVDRVGLNPAEVERITVDAGGPHYPSGHVIGAVMLYGYLVVVAGRMCSRTLRLAVRGVAVTLITATGFSRIWYGAHWPSDVLGGYALGGLLLVLLVALHRCIGAGATHGQPAEDDAQVFAGSKT
jgi:membrane-associated phospholipid phosphatase